MKLQDLDERSAHILVIGFGWYLYYGGNPLQSWFVVSDDDGKSAAERLVNMKLLKKQKNGELTVYRINKKGRELVEWAVLNA